MRLSRKNKNWAHLAVAVAASTLSVGLMTGCESGVNPLDIKSFLDPSELAGRSKKDTTIKPILEQLDPREEVRREFVAAQPPTQDDLTVSATDYVINKNDLLSIEISDLQGPGTATTKTSRVSESGNISLPFVGQIKVEGLTEYEIEQKIVESYRTAKILEKTNVTVVAAERRGSAFDVLGAVARPGQYGLVDPDFRVLNALTLVGDTTSPLLTDLYILRRTDLNRPSTKGPTTPGGPSTPAPTNPSRPAAGPDDLKPTSSVDDLRPVQRTAMVNPYSPRAAVIGGPRAFPMNAVATTHGTPAMQQSVLLQADSTIPGAPGRDEVGEYRIVDGKKVYISTNPVPPAGAPAPVAPAPGGPADLVPSTVAPSAVVPAAPATTAPAADAPVTPPVAIDPVATAPSVAPAPTPASPAGGSGSSKFPGFRDLAAPDNIRVIHIPLDRLRGGELQYNIVIKPKDMLVVQNLPIGEYYMGGHVGQAGVFSLTQRRITLKQAIVSARMLDQLAIPERTDLVRRLPNNQEIYIRVDLARIFEGKDPDIYLRPDDQVYVGTNFLAPFLAAIRSAFRFTYGFGFLYDRNFAAEENNRTGSGN